MSSAVGYAMALGQSTEQPDDDKNQNDQEQQMNQLPGPRDLWYASRPKISKEPQDQQDNDEQFKHIASLSIHARCATTVPTLSPNGV
jgi:hypothetical protein